LLEFLLAVRINCRPVVAMSPLNVRKCQEDGRAVYLGLLLRRLPGDRATRRIATIGKYAGSGTHVEEIASFLIFWKTRLVIRKFETVQRSEPRADRRESSDISSILDE